MGTTEQETKEYEAGYNAAFLGKELADNPHPAGTEAHDEWERGWEAFDDWAAAQW